MVYNAERALELVHIDLCGPITPLMADGNECFLLIVDIGGASISIKGCQKLKIKEAWH